MASLRKKRIDNIHRRLIDHVSTRYEQINPVSKQGLFNYKCFANSVEYAKNNEGFGITEVILVEEGYPILHYVVHNGEEYLEVTLGYQAEYNRYYKIREVPESDWRYIANEFSTALDAWRFQFTNWFDRNVLRIDRVV